MVLAAILGVLIGLVVGTVGGGGAVLAVPALVYGMGMDVHEATTASLAVVAAAGATAGVAQARRGTVCWTSAAWFAAGAAAGGIVGTLVNKAVGGDVLMLAFSAVMLLAARATWVRAGSPSCAAAGCPPAQARLLVPFGFAIGTLTGAVGVGGGFVVVPALAVGLSFGMREAMSTSMVIIAIASTAALVEHLLAGSALDVPLVLVMGAATVAGALVGPRIADRLPVQALGRGFAALVAGVALAVAGAAAAGL